MKKQTLNILLFFLSLILLIIGIQMFYNAGIVIDELSLNFRAYFGGEFWGYLAWINLALLLTMCILSFVNMINNRKK